MEIIKYSDLNNNENIAHHIWNATKATQRGKFIALDVCTRKDDRLKIKNLSFFLKTLGKEGQFNIK